MKEIMFEVVLSVLILSLLFLAINVFQSGMEVVSSVSEQTMESEKVDLLILPEEQVATMDTNKKVSGSELIGVIRYYKDWASVRVVVVYDGSTKEYINNLYSSNPFSVSDATFMRKDFKVEQSEAGGNMVFRFTKLN